MATSHMDNRGAGYANTKANAPAFYSGVVGATGFRGTAALPTFSFEEDPDTGVWSQAANTLSLSAGGTEIARLASTGITANSGDFLGDIGAANNVVWIPAVSLPTIYFTTGTWTAIRTAAGDYTMRHTEADETSTIEYPLSAFGWIKSTASKGLQLLGVRYVYTLNDVNVTAHTYDLLDTVYANNVAVAVGTAYGGTLTGTLATTAQPTNPYVTAITTGTDTYISDLQGLFFQVTVDNAATSEYDSDGLFVDFNWTA